MNREEVKLAILTKLDADESLAKELASEYGIKYATVIRWKHEYGKAKKSGTLDKVYNCNKLLETQTSEILSDIENFDLELQQTAQSLNGKIRSKLVNDIGTKECEILTNCVCKLRESFFKHPSIAIQQNFNKGATENYKGFLDD